jgi:hypothetical protein
MADKSTGDNKTHQLLMALITTIAAPIIVFMITNNLKSNTAVATITPPTLAATLPAQPGPTDKPGPTEKPVQATIPGISDPSGSIPAGVPALVDGLALTVSAQDVSADGKSIQVRVHVKNTGADRRTLVFTPGAVTMQDDSGHRYEAAFGDKKSGCKKTDLGASRNVTIDPQGEVTLSSTDSANPGAWCADTSTSLPLFTGPIVQRAKKLHVQINGVGPFKGFQVEIGL